MIRTEKRQSSEPGKTGRSPSRFIIAWLLLLMLTGINIGLAHVPTGRWQAPVALAIAGVMAIILVSVYMHLQRAAVLLRLTACVGFLWLWFMWVLLLADYLTRVPTAI